MQISVDSTIGDGDFAATFGRATWVSGTKGSDAPVVQRRPLMVWRSEADGRWRIPRELLNEDVSAARHRVPEPQPVRKGQ